MAFIRVTFLDPDNAVCAGLLNTNSIQVVMAQEGHTLIDIPGNFNLRISETVSQVEALIDQAQ